MRAIIRCNTSISKEAFQSVLSTKRWWPPLAQDDSEVVQHRDHIVSLVAPEDKVIVQKTVWFMIYSHTLRTWGLVNSPQPGGIEIRLRNESSPALRNASENLLTMLQDHSNKNSGSAGPLFQFPDTIEVLEPESQHRAYYGEPLPTTPSLKWTLAKKERHPEWILGNVLLAVGLGLMIITVPPMESLVGLLLPKAWVIWGDGVLGRLSTSAMASSAVSYVSVLIHYFDLKRLGAIRWSLLRRDAE